MDEAVNIFQLLVQAGAVPGEDFSCDLSRQSYRLSDRCLQLLQAAYPQVAWEDVLATPTEDPQPTVDQIHQDLGIPFIDQLLERIGARLWTLPEAQCLDYLNQMALGLQERTGLALYTLLQSRLDLATLARLEWLMRQGRMAPCEVWLADLVWAAGGTETDVIMAEDGIALSETGLQLLQRVWVGNLQLTPLPHAC